MTKATGLALVATLVSFATVIAGPGAALMTATSLGDALVQTPAHPRETQALAWTLHHPEADWKARISEIQAMPDIGKRREAMRSWIEFRHRTQAAALSTFDLVELLPDLPPARQTSVALLNLHWLADDTEAQAVLEPWIPLDSYARWTTSLAEIGQVPEAVPYLPDMQDLEEEFDFYFEELKPLAQSGLKVFLEGRATPRQLAYWMGMHNSAHGQLGKRIGARVMAADPTLRGLEADCGFRVKNVQVQAGIIFLKYLNGYVREDTFRSWFRMAGDPELTECLVERIVGSRNH